MCLCEAENNGKNVETSAARVDVSQIEKPQFEIPFVQVFEINKLMVVKCPTHINVHPSCLSIYLSVFLNVRLNRGRVSMECFIFFRRKVVGSNPAAKITDGSGSLWILYYLQSALFVFVNLVHYICYFKFVFVNLFHCFFICFCELISLYLLTNYIAFVNLFHCIC